ncbi:nuclear transport factor 2 family protein [Dactylosporangium sp. CS-033363]|uniref:nuclear transport factor 2 family protein n=1 Tax=Dactylosporangium sp. CS-033363 TaxID=3239935 RepID=UPI003D920A58
MDELERLVAEAAVTRVLFDYCDLVDANRQADVLELFTGNAVFDHGHGRVYRGRAELARMFRSLDDNLATSHHLSNVRVTVAGSEHARADSYVYAYHRRRLNHDTVHLWGRYADTLVLRDGRWLFASRALLAAAEDGVPPDAGFASRYALIARAGRPDDGRAW